MGIVLVANALLNQEPIGQTLTIDPQSIALTPADFPSGFELYARDTGPTSNETIASERDNPQEFLARLQQWGRISGYASSYYNSNNETGAKYVNGSVVSMKTGAGAHSYFDYLKQEDAKELLPVSVPAIGEESHAGTRTVSDGSKKYVISFRVKNVLVTVIGVGATESALQDAQRYAQLLESRLNGTAENNAAKSVDNSATRVVAPTLTPIPLRGLGDSVKCGDLWEIGAVVAPDFTLFPSSVLPKGQYAKVRFLLTNLQNRTAYLNQFGEKLTLIGTLDGRDVIFDATDLGTSLKDEAAGYVNWFEEIPPSVTTKAQAVFDVNPTAMNWRLHLSDEDCSAEIALYDVK